jgi:hypothetical protein
MLHFSEGGIFTYIIQNSCPLHSCLFPLLCLLIYLLIHSSSLLLLILSEVMSINLIILVIIYNRLNNCIPSSC